MNTIMFIVLLFLFSYNKVSCTVYTQGHKGIANLPTNTYIGQGDIYIGGVQQIFDYSSSKMCASTIHPFSEYMFTAANIYGILKVNKDRQLLRNITLGVIVADYCRKTTIAIGHILRMLSGYDDDTCTLFSEAPKKVVAVVGPISSPAVASTANVLNLYRTPQLCQVASSDELSDRTKYPYLYRMIPADSHQVDVMIDTMLHFNWTYIYILHEENTYGFNGLKFLRQVSSRRGICIAESYPLADNYETTDYDNLVLTLMRGTARTVVIFAFPYKVNRVMRAVHRVKAHGRFMFILSEASSRSVFEGAEEAGVGALLTRINVIPDSGLQEWIAELSPANNPDIPGLREMWQQHFHCNSTSLSEKCWSYKFKDLPRFSYNPIGVLIVEAVTILARAIDALVTDRCPRARVEKSLLAECVKPEILADFISRTSIESPVGRLGYENGEIMRDYQIQQLQKLGDRHELVRVGIWQQSHQALEIYNDLVHWHENARDLNKFPPEQEPSSVPESVCSKPCKAGEFYIQGDLPCCWDCRKCRSNEFVAENATTCKLCPILTWPDDVTFMTCVMIPPTFLTWSDVYGIGLMVLAIAGLLATLVVIRLVVKYRSRRVVKGASWEMLIIILLGLLMAFTAVPILIARPTNLLCLINRVAFSVSCTFIFGPLLVKTNRVYQVFRASAKLQNPGAIVSARVQHAIIVIIILIQVALFAVSGLMWPIEAAQTMPVLTEKHVELSCQQHLEGLLVPLTYNLVLIFFCSVLAFLTRKLPDNFNESWYIFLCVSTTLFIWIAFLPTYFAAFYAYHKAALLALALVLNGAVTLACLFGPKIYALYYIADKDIKITDFSNSSFDQTSHSRVSSSNAARESAKM